MTEAARDSLLLASGPVTTAERTGRVTLRDRGSRDIAVIPMTARVGPRLVGIAGGADVVAVPLQRSGTFAVEDAALTKGTA